MLTTLLSYLLIYKYVALFVFVFGIAVIVPLPINALLLATGAFASFGYFNLEISIVVAIVANVSGDMTDFFLARYYGPKIFEKFKIKKHYYFERLEHGFRTNAGFTVFITRFAGPVDLFGTLLAGSIGIPIKTFLIYDFLGNTVITTSVLIIGYFAGSYWQDFSGLIEIASWILITIIVLVFVVRVFLRHRRRARSAKKDIVS